MLRPRIPISEIFQSLQGEGRNTGCGVVFVRFWGCNLDCQFCDSKYARHKDYKKEMIQMNFETVIDKIKSFNNKHIVFTGGEPSLYEPIIDDIMYELSKDELFDWYWEIETNGSRELQNYYDQVNVSYKLSNANTRVYPLKALGEKYDYKFVVGNFDDLNEVDKIVEKYNLNRRNVFIMPLGTTIQSQERLDLARISLEKGYRYAPRQHIIWFGNKRGA